MNVILCLDDNNGMMFNHRRQSRDKEVLKDIILISRNSRLYMNEYSYKLFKDLSIQNVLVSSEFLQQANEGEYCFVEDRNVLPFCDKIEKLIIYRWNRKYPADFYFDIVLDEVWELTEIKESTGTSHEKIKKEIYIKCAKPISCSN